MNDNKKPGEERKVQLRLRAGERLVAAVLEKVRGKCCPGDGVASAGSDPHPDGRGNRFGAAFTQSGLSHYRRHDAGKDHARGTNPERAANGYPDRRD